MTAEHIDITQIRVVGFDLDDTLHFFKDASTRAMEDVYAYIAAEFGPSITKLRFDYEEILKAGQSDHFTASKTSREYRTERFTRLLADNSILGHQHVAELLDIYDESLSKNLKLKNGAYETVAAAKQQGKIVIIITEGPEDAQTLTLRRLGLADMIDRVYSSSTYNQSKEGGLFQMALDDLGCHPQEILFVGDNPTRDYDAPQKLGLQCILLNDGGAEENERITVETLLEIRDMLSPPSELAPHISDDIQP